MTEAEEIDSRRHFWMDLPSWLDQEQFHHSPLTQQPGHCTS
jgi:hypothetical protein